MTAPGAWPRDRLEEVMEDGVGGNGKAETTGCSGDRRMYSD